MIIQRFCFFVCTIVALCLCVFSLAQNFSGTIHHQRSAFLLNLPIALQTQTSRNRINQVLEPLGFMVWPQQRSTALANAKNVIQQEINKRPHDPELWRALLFVQIEANTPAIEKYWTLKNAVHLAAWNKKATFWLARPCFEHYELLNDIDPKLCYQVFAGFPPNFSARRIADNMNVDEAALEKFLNKTRVYKPKGLE